jgi:hypothetical protein
MGAGAFGGRVQSALIYLMVYAFRSGIMPILSGVSYFYSSRRLAMAEEPPILSEEDDRRSFLQTCGRFAITVPPAMTILLSTSLSSKAIAKSTGGGPKPDRGSFKGSDSGPTGGDGSGHSGSSLAGLVGADCAHDRQKSRRAGCR